MISIYNASVSGFIIPNFCNYIMPRVIHRAFYTPFITAQIHEQLHPFTYCRTLSTQVMIINPVFP